MIRIALALALLACLDTAAFAQSDDPAPRRHGFTISGGVSSSGSYPIGDATATLRRNETSTTTPGPFTYFTADASIRRAAALEARVGYALTRALSLEFGGAYAQPTLAVDVAQDAESTPQTLADEHLAQYVVEGAGLWQISAISLGSHARPYVTAGGGYLRQLYGDRVKVETGKLFHVGGGVRYWLHGGRSSGRSLGVRGEARLQMRSGGIELADSRRFFPVVSVYGFWGL